MQIMSYRYMHKCTYTRTFSFTVDLKILVWCFVGGLQYVRLYIILANLLLVTD
jgi:hypothetical protein